MGSARDGADAARPGVPDEGFTLIEVIVSLAVLAIVATAALYFFVGGTRAVAEQQRSQSAVSVANEAMEAAFGVDPLLASGSNSLIAGRTQAAVAAAWTGAAGFGLTGLATSYLAYDPAATAGSTPTIAITRTRTLDHVDYTVYALVGTCYRASTVGGGSSPCDKITGQATDPGVAPAGMSKMQRVMVLVTWSGSGASSTCPGGTCSYQAQSLVDPNSDIKWNSTTVPIAVDDTALVDPGHTVNIDVLRNDIIGTVMSSPIRDVSNLTGSGAETLRADGTVDFAAPANAAGLMTFQYRLKDQSGRWSGFATVSVQVTPQAVADSATTHANTAVTVAVGANDIGTIGTLSVKIPATHGTTSVAGTKVVYTPSPGYIGADSFEYSFLDPMNLQSTQAKVTVSVTEYATPLVADYTVQVPATATGTVGAVDWLTLTGNPSGYLVKVLSFSPMNGSTLSVDATPFTATKVGSVLTFGQQGNILSSQTISYQVLTPDQGKTSTTKTITVQVTPVATNDSFTVARGSTNQLNVGANDVPNNFGVAIGTLLLQKADVQIVTSSCGSLALSQPNIATGIVSYTAPNSAKTCTLTYVLRSQGLTPQLVSNTGTVTVKVQ